MTSAVKTQGIVVSVERAASPAEYDAIGEVYDVQGGGGGAPEIDVTSFASAAKEYLLGLPDNGQFTLTMNELASDTGHTRLRALLASGDAAGFTIVAPSTAITLSFDARVQNYEYAMRKDDAWRTTVTLRLTGAVTQT